MTGIHPQFEHEKYDELCALATAGALTPAESKVLFAHLSECEECREAFAQYQHIATDGMPFLAGHFAVAPAAAAFDESSALAQLLQAAGPPHPQPVPAPSQTRAIHWLHPALARGLLAATLLVGVALASYWLGLRSMGSPTHGANVQPNTELDQIAAEKLALENTIQADNQRLAALGQQAAGSREEAERLRSEANAAAENLAAMTASKSQSDAQLAALTQQRDASAARLQDAEKKYQTAQDELSTLQNQRQQDLLHMASLEDRVNNLSASLKDSDSRAKNDEQYLSSDKDIRDLIGARNLYIADIMDVDGTGNSRKPFGRVFYTKTKSLIFYAYDLDRQPGVKRASTFQVWGRTGSNDQKPVNLGILYMDSETNRRWTLRVDNPRQLAQLDAIFVTIEPHAQSEKPTGKPFLYASLRREPNHP